MSSAERTYSGQKSYHEMLLRAQSLSPALTYAVCKLLLAIEVKQEAKFQSSKVVSVESATGEFSWLFSSHDPHSSRMARFLKDAFGGFNVFIGFPGDRFNTQQLIADTQFVQWLQSDAVTVDDSVKLVTIKL